MTIRAEQSGDIPFIWKINEKAFGQEAEADLVDNLRKRGIPLVSLVSEEAGELIGHILFTPVLLVGSENNLNLKGLAPMAVAPHHQKKGVGSALVKAGIEVCRAMDTDALVVLGHPNYYPKFGFKSASEFNVKSEFNAPEEAFMVLELKPGVLDGHRGVIMYHKLFKEV